MNERVDAQLGVPDLPTLATHRGREQQTMSGIRLRSGVFLPPFHPIDEDPSLCYRRDIQLMEWLDQLGYEEAWFGEHHQSGWEMLASPELLIAAAAEHTKRIKLGTGVISLSYHNPFMVATRIAQLDHQTMGRVMFGAGPGLHIYDAKMLGIDPNKMRDRLPEALDVILRLFRGERVTKKTDWFDLKDAFLQVPCYSDPHPEVVVASSKTPSGGRVAGTFGLGLLCVIASKAEGFDALATNWALANEIATENGHQMDRSKLRLVAPIHIAETREQARANVRFGLEKWVKYWTTTTPRSKDRYNRMSAEGIDLPDAVCKIEGGVIGTPDEAIALIERLQAKQGDFGCFLQMGHNWADWEQTKKSYELYARFVVPHFRKSNRNRAYSLQLFRDTEEELKQAQQTTIENAFAKFNSDREASGKSTITMPRF